MADAFAARMKIKLLFALLLVSLTCLGCLSFGDDDDDDGEDKVVVAR